MDEAWLRTAAEPIRPLKAFLVIAMPDCLLFGSYLRGAERWSLDEVAGYFGDLTRANRQAVNALGSWSASLQITIETSDALIMIREIDEHFVAALFFERSTPLGMVRLHASQLLERAKVALPRIGGAEIPLGVRIVRFLERYAPDPHTIKLRLAVRAGIESELMDHPEHLTSEQVALLEREAKSLLGLERLAV